MSQSHHRTELSIGRGIGRSQLRRTMQGMCLEVQLLLAKPLVLLAMLADKALAQVLLAQGVAECGCQLLQRLMHDVCQQDLGADNVCC